MCDFDSVEAGSLKIIETGHYSKVNSGDELDGHTYMQRQEIPWTPWCSVYNIGFLKRNNIWFEENVRFEDSDYVINSIVTSRKIRFVPVRLVAHTVSQTQQSVVGNNVDAITDLFKISDRVRRIAEKYENISPDTFKAIAGHHWYKHKYDILRYLWRLPVKDIRRILLKYPAYTPSPYMIVNLCSRHPDIGCVLLTAAKPLFPFVRFVWKIKKKIFRQV